MTGKAKKETESTGPGGDNLAAVSRQYQERAEQREAVNKQAAEEREERDKNKASSTVEPDYPSDEPVTETKPGPDVDEKDKPEDES